MLSDEASSSELTMMVSSGSGTESLSVTESLLKVVFLGERPGARRSGEVTKASELDVCEAEIQPEVPIAPDACVTEVPPLLTILLSSSDEDIHGRKKEVTAFSAWRADVVSNGSGSTAQDGGSSVEAEASWSGNSSGTAEDGSILGDTSFCSVRVGENLAAGGK
jgi:hypothetical protein